MRSYSSYIHIAPQSRLISYSLAVAVVLLILSGVLDRPTPPIHWLVPACGLILGWLAWELYRGVIRFWTSSEPSERDYDAYNGLGLALLGALAILLRLSGGLYSPFYPVFYLAIAFLASFGTASQGTIWFGYAWMLEFAAVFAAGVQNPKAVSLGALHLAFLSLFAGSHHLYLRGMLWEAYHARKKKNFRKSSGVLSQVESVATPVEQAPQGLTQVSIKALESDKQALLSLLKEGLDAHGCAFLWIKREDSTYEVLGIDTENTDLDVGPFPMRSGVLAGLFKSRTPLRLARTKDKRIHLPYYGSQQLVRSFLAVPVFSGQEIRGVLCADRAHPAPFSAREESLLAAAAIVFGQALESEQSSQRSGKELERLTVLGELGEEFNQLHSLESLSETALRGVERLVSFDWGFVSRYHDEDKSHEVLSTVGLQAPFSQGSRLPLEGSYLSLALKYKCPMPKAGELRSSGPFFAQEDPVPFTDVNSLYIIPLLLKDEPLGVLVLASEKEQAFIAPETEKNLAILSNHLAMAMGPLCGCSPHIPLPHQATMIGVDDDSPIISHLKEAFHAVQNNDRRLSLIMAEIDHLALFEEHCGAEMTDNVVKGVTKVFDDFSRESDVIGHFRGNGFLMILEDTSAVQALRLADSIRKKVSEIEFLIEDEDEPDWFSMTVSMGISSYPEHGITLEQVLQCTEEALLSAKRREGNRVVLHADSEQPVEEVVPQPSISAVQGWGWGSLPPAEDPNMLTDSSRWSWSSFANSQQLPPSLAANDDPERPLGPSPLDSPTPERYTG